MKTASVRLLFVTLALALVQTMQAEPTLVGHPGLKGQSLDAEGTKGILLGKKVALGDTRVVIIIAKTNAGQDSFLQSSVSMNTGQFQTHWRRLFMTGGGSAPKIVETEDEAIKLATETPGAVLVVDTAKVGTLTVLSAAK